MAKRRKKSLLSTLDERETLIKKEKILEELKEETVLKPKVVRKKPVRVSVDFPIDLYAMMKEDTLERGQTLKGFIVSLVRSHYNNRDRE